jgi:signal transduction histidine kinase
MTWGLVYVALAVASGLTTLALALYARPRDEPGSTYFAAMMAGAAIWSLSYAASLLMYDPSVHVLFELPVEIGKAVLVPSWLLFALAYTGRGGYISRRLTAAVFVLPAATMGLIVTNDAHHLVWREYQIIEQLGIAISWYDPGIWHWIHVGYGWLLVGIGVALIFELVLARGSLYRDQAVALVVGTLVATVAQGKAAFFLGPYPGLDLTPVALGVTGVSFGYALFRYRLLGVSPAVSRLGTRAAVDDVGVAVAIITRSGDVAELNAAAEAVLGVDTKTALGEPLVSYLPIEAFDPAAPPRTIELTNGERRTFEVTTSTVADQHGDPLGYTVVLSDVTVRERQRQRVEVLNRVLRHNLRNDLTVVLGYAETLAAGLDGENRRMAELIEKNARSLVDLGENAREVEAFLEAEETTFDAARVTRSVLADLAGEHPEATVEVDIADSIDFYGVDRAFEAIVENLVENAIEHGAEPVSVSLAPTDGGARLVVRDAGSGIPEHELAVLRSGGETALEHGSGLGLWAVYWGSTLMGATIDIETPESGGSRVAVTFPAGSPE